MKIVKINNRFIVTYNPVLLHSLNAHVCSSIKAIKYVLRYIAKGTDQAI